MTTKLHPMAGHGNPARLHGLHAQSVSPRNCRRPAFGVARKLEQNPTGIKHIIPSHDNRDHLNCNTFNIQHKIESAQHKLRNICSYIGSAAKISLHCGCVVVRKRNAKHPYLTRINCESQAKVSGRMADMRPLRGTEVEADEMVCALARLAKELEFAIGPGCGEARRAAREVMALAVNYPGFHAAMRYLALLQAAALARDPLIPPTLISLGGGAAFDRYLFIPRKAVQR